MSDKESGPSLEKVQAAAESKQAVVSDKLSGLEGWLNDIFGEKCAIQLPKGAKEWIVKYSPWLVLAGGVLELLAALSFWRAGHYVDQLVNWANDLSVATGGERVHHLGVMWYVAVSFMLVQAVLMLLAFSGMQKRKKAGWNFIFYSSVLSAVLGLVYLFVPGYGVGSLLGTVVGTVVGMFFLFQIRNYYK